jgi:hypothetical protein
MTDREYFELLNKGELLFAKIVTDLNDISFKFIRKDNDDANNYRRREDCHETCIALALLMDKLNKPVQTGARKIIIRPKDSGEQKTTFVKPKHQYPERERVMRFLEKYGICFKEGNDGNQYVRIDFKEDGESR